MVQISALKQNGLLQTLAAGGEQPKPAGNTHTHPLTWPLFCLTSSSLWNLWGYPRYEAAAAGKTSLWSAGCLLGGSTGSHWLWVTLSAEDLWRSEQDQCQPLHYSTTTASGEICVCKSIWQLGLDSAVYCDIYLVISVSYLDSCLMIHIVLRSPCQNSTSKFSDTKQHLCTLFSYFQFQRVHCFSVSTSSERVYFNFILYFDVMAATLVCLVIFQFHSNKWETTFWIKLFWLNLSDKLSILWDVMYKDYPDHTQ